MLTKTKFRADWQEEHEPSSNGMYLAEVQMSHFPDVVEIFTDYFKNGKWGFGYAVNRWAKIEGWVPAEILPQKNVGVLVYIPEEDHHITSGMWDESEEWILLDEYRKPESEVTHWMPLPEKPDTE